MEISEANLFCDMGQMEEDFSFFHQYSLDRSLDEMSFESASVESYPRSTTSFNGFSAEASPPLTTESERQLKQLKSSCWKPSKPASSSSPFSQIISFGTSKPSHESSVLDTTLKPKIGFNISSSPVGHESCENLPSLTNKGTKRGFGAARRCHLLAQGHVLAERKRREKLTERFIALSALIPGLKKKDKASVLGDAIEHVEQLQERLRELEKQATTMESVVLVKKARLFAEEDTWSDEESIAFSDQNLPEIEARVSDRDVLLRIHCEEQKGLLSYTLNEVEKLHLSVVQSSALKFGESTVDFTIIAKIEDGFCITVKEMEKNLRTALLSFISVGV